MWADRPDLSFLRTPEDTRALLEAAGFHVTNWIDNTEAALAEAAAERARFADTRAGRPIPGLHVIAGPAFKEKMWNAQRALAEGRTRLINAVMVRG